MAWAELDSYLYWDKKGISVEPLNALILELVCVPGTCALLLSLRRLQRTVYGSRRDNYTRCMYIPRLQPKRALLSSPLISHPPSPSLSPNFAPKTEYENEPYGGTHWDVGPTRRNCGMLALLCQFSPDCFARSLLALPLGVWRRTINGLRFDPRKRLWTPPCQLLRSLRSFLRVLSSSSTDSSSSSSSSFFSLFIVVT